jgi:hypothetical protein
MAKHKSLVEVLREKIDQNLEDISTDNQQVGIIVNRMTDIYRYTSINLYSLHYPFVLELKNEIFELASSANALLEKIHKKHEDICADKEQVKIITSHMDGVYQYLSAMHFHL